MPERVRRILIANRGEVAVRVARTVRRLGHVAVATHAASDARALHVRVADEAVELPGDGPAAYLDATAVVDAATRTGAALLHPGWGFLSESAELAERCAAAGVTFVGPDPAALATLGDKTAARALAERMGVRVPAATAAGADVETALAFAREHGPVMVKAVAGGGGRGMREVLERDGELEPALREAWRRCAGEALAASGSAALYAERLITGARHVEVQAIGDGTGAVDVLGDRDCSLQRRHQKLVEIAPAPDVHPAARERMAEAATALLGELRYRGVGTVEFLLDAAGEPAFIECNPRLQVEHTVTEEVYGVDLVAVQLALATGLELAELGLAGRLARGVAVQARVSAEREAPDGLVVPTGGTLERLRLPAGDHVRVDAGMAEGDDVDPAFDPLVLKVIAHGADLAEAVPRAAAALDELITAGVQTNAAALAALLRRPEIVGGRLRTDLVVDAAAERPAVADASGPAVATDRDAPLAVEAPLMGVVVEVLAGPGASVRAGQAVLVVEAMKMHHDVVAPRAGVVTEVRAEPGERIAAGGAAFVLGPADQAVPDGAEGAPPATAEPDAEVRADLERLLERRAGLLDAGREAAVARRHDRGRRTARENLEDLCDPGTFSEMGGLAVAAQKARMPEADLIARSPADGVVCGTADVGGVRCAVLSYDYTVMAGTQGLRGHAKTDRVLALAERRRLPVVLFAEGGGGRPGDTDGGELFGLVVPTFASFARLSGLVPRVGIVSGRCFAGNAALLGCCDVVIATPDASIGMGGPAMIEGGGLGRFAPEEVGPADVQTASGVIDVLAADEAEAVDVAKRFLAHTTAAPAFAAHGTSHGTEPPSERPAGTAAGQPDDAAGDRGARHPCADQRELRSIVPADPKRVHDARRVLEVVADSDSVLELRRDYGRGVITALARIEGRTVGVVANDPSHLSGAIDAPASDKAARFLQLCDAFGLPIVSLVDTPGFMVGPDSEAEAMVRRCSRIFVTAATLSVPWVCVVVRRAFGLGAQAMAGGGFHEPVLNVAWPSAEFGAMGVEGAVRLGLRRELEAIDDEAERERRVQELVAQVRANSTALHMAQHFEIDDVIDPVDTRLRIAQALAGAPVTPPPGGRRRTMVDTW